MGGFNADLTGKTALVTGAARGQGRAHALTLARNGADVIAIDIADQIATTPYQLATMNDLRVTAKEIESLGRRVLAIQADVRSQEELDDAVARGLAEFGGIDIVIANAGILGVGSFWELTEDQWSDVVDTDLSGVWRTAKAVAPHLIERRSGSIVMTSSINGFEPAMVYAHYTAAKLGVIGLMRSVALELAQFGVRCNAVCPGVVDTEMVNWQGVYDMMAGHENGSRDEANGALGHFHALKGAGFLDPQRVADAALWLVSDGASAVTGTAVPVDAGHLTLPGFNPAPVA
jgi:SDR family mycofactocin-dependent oxidoreductase